MDYIKGLRYQKQVEISAIARLDLDIAQSENKLIRLDKYGLEWCLELERKNALVEKRQILIQRLEDLKIELIRTEQFSL